MRNVLIGIIVLVGVAFLIILAPSMMGGLESFRTQSQTDNFSVSTGVGVTSDNVTLTQSLFQDDTHYAVVSSNLSTDVPLANLYTSNVKKLQVSGLTANASRVLTVTYSIGALSSNVDNAVEQMPLIWFFGIVALILLTVVIVIMALKNR